MPDVLTPDELRKLAEGMRFAHARGTTSGILAEMWADHADAAAAAWEAEHDELVMIRAHYASHNAMELALHARIEALEKVVVAARALMVEWTMGVDKVPTTETRVEDALAAAVAALAGEEKS